MNKVVYPATIQTEKPAHLQKQFCVAVQEFLLIDACYVIDKSVNLSNEWQFVSYVYGNTSCASKVMFYKMGS
jgi:hypothetical protein